MVQCTHNILLQGRRRDVKEILMLDSFAFCAARSELPTASSSRPRTVGRANNGPWTNLMFRLHAMYEEKAMLRNTEDVRQEAGGEW